MQDFHSKYEAIIAATVQIATPNSSGTGFYLKDYDVIITNEHLVRSDREVVVENPFIESQVAQVIFIDEKHDIAFVSIQKTDKDLPGISLLLDDAQLGQEVVAIGRPIDQGISYAAGIISSLSLDMNGVQYIQHNGHLHANSSGGPLINSSGQVLGINTFIASSRDRLSFALPSQSIKDILDLYMPLKGKIVQRCPSCQSAIDESLLRSDYCYTCGVAIYPISKWKVHVPTGIHKTIEDLLSELNFRPALSRRGPSMWQVKRGSASIQISYHEKSGLIESDATLVALPDHDLNDLYKYLLKLNYTLQELTFSVKSDKVILSLLIYDQYFNPATARKLFEKLFETADYYDDILVNEYGAQWLS